MLKIDNLTMKHTKQIKKKWFELQADRFHPYQFPLIFKSYKSYTGSKPYANPMYNEIYNEIYNEVTDG